MIKIENLTVEWIYRRYDRITRCKVTNELDESVFYGETHCSKNDSFVRDIGRKIALSRALKKAIPNDKPLRTKIWEVYRTMPKYDRWKIKS